MKNKNIAVYVPSRSSPENFEKTIDMLVNQADSIDNFDIFAVIDSDQIDMYSHVTKKYTNIVCAHPPHMGPNSPAILQSLFNFIEQNDYYFIWTASDDFWGLSKGWDTEICSKKNAFHDQYFMLHTTDPLSRNFNAATTHFRLGWYPFHPGGSCRSEGSVFDNKGMKSYSGIDSCSCWRSNDFFPIIADPAYLIYHYHELLPIATKKWYMAIRDFFDENYVGPDPVFLHAALAHILSVHHGYSRILQTDVYYEGLINGENSAKVVREGLTRDEYYKKWAITDNFSIVHPIAEKVAGNIFEHYSNKMCDARGIKRKCYIKDSKIGLVKGIIDF